MLTRVIQLTLLDFPECSKAVWLTEHIYFIYLFINLAKDKLAGEISQN